MSAFDRVAPRTFCLDAAALSLLEFVASEKVAYLKGCRFSGIGAMDCVFLNGAGKHLTNGALFGVSGIGSAHQFAQIRNCVALFKNQRKDWSGGHEAGQRIKERPLCMNVIK